VRYLFNFLFVLALLLFGNWGFYAHRQINRLAVFTLPPPLIGFYKKHITYISEASVNPDRRRFAVPGEGPRHYIDIDHFGDSAVYTMPRYWKEAVEVYGEDTLKAYGILPWHITTVYYRLRDAFLIRDPQRILNLSADLGHYIADAHVPLHTTENYNGQLTGQEGIHAFWESRVPELLSSGYDFFVGKAGYISNPQLKAWEAVVASHREVDSVLVIEKRLARLFGERKFSFETRGKQTIKVYSVEFSTAYHEALNGMIERQMRGAVKMIGDFWYSAWLDAGQPDVKELMNYQPTEAELEERRKEVEELKRYRLNVREHENEN
jgi:hypothetical protein